MSEAAAPSGPPSVIPYVEPHDGPKRILVLHLTTGNGMAKKIPPVVGIDGRQYVVIWGSLNFEVPADRAVHLSVVLHGDYMQQPASALLPPGGDVVLTYETHYTKGYGTLR